MYRKTMEELMQWKNSAHRKPLVIRGARQVGKTWLMEEFGRTAYENMVCINFDSNRRMEALFDADLQVDRLLMGLELYAGKKIDPSNTLLVFDEVQEVPKALASLKYFHENAPEYHIVCAGSLLGVALHQGTSFPVGKVDFLDLYPLSFEEFLVAMGKCYFAEKTREKVAQKTRVLPRGRRNGKERTKERPTRPLFCRKSDRGIRVRGHRRRRKQPLRRGI